MPSLRYNNLTIHYNDKLEIDTLIDEVFKKRTYYAELETNTPTIIDAGAHIGTVTLYLATLYPRAHFICIEPSPANVKLLEQNLTENLVEDFSIIQKALVGKQKTGTIPLYTNPNLTVFNSILDGGWTGNQTKDTVEVETLHLSDLLDTPIDLLKLDIEGAEIEVLQEAKNQLHNVKHLIMEFHGTKTNKLDTILPMLRSVFHSVEVTKDERKEENWQNQLYVVECSQ